MKKISSKDIVEFRRKSDRSKQNFASDLRLNREKPHTGEGGNYWICSISAISNSFKLNNLQPIIDKRNELEEKYEAAESKNTKVMYQRNIDILCSCEEFDLDKWKPSVEMKFIKRHKGNPILDIEGLQIQVSPNHFFTFQEGEIKGIGAIWFIAKLDGYKKNELGIFADILYRYLNFYFSDNYVVNPQYCIVVDVFRGIDVNYLQVEKNEIPQMLNSTIAEIKSRMKAG